MRNNTGYSRLGARTGKNIQLWCSANCVSRANEIFYEHVIYDTTGMIQQLGLDVFDVARRMVETDDAPALPANIMASEPERTVGQAKPETMKIPAPPRVDIERLVRAMMHTIWNWRNFGAIDQVYHPNVVVQGSTGRVYRGTGQLRSFVMSLVAMFPDLWMLVDDIHWVGNPDEGYVVPVRRNATGTHNGNGIYGRPTGKEVYIWGINTRKCIFGE